MLTYIRREITKRGRQTAIIATAMALAVAAVLLISSAATGVASAQRESLQAMNGVGTDITVTTQPDFAEGGGRPRMEFDPGQATTGEDGATEFSSQTLSMSPMSQAMSADTLTTVGGTDGVAAATGVLALAQMDLSGSISSGSSEEGSADATGRGTQGAPQGASGGSGGAGGPMRGGFGMDQTSVLGLDPEVTDVGPASGATLSSGRLLATGDTTSAVVSSTYAESESLSEGSTFTLGGTDFTVVGILSEESSQEASDVWIPLAEAQQLSGETGNVSTIYVKASDADSVDAVAAALGTALPDQTVSTQSDLASTVRGSLSSASSWISGLGKWLTIGILVLAFAITALFVVSSIGRRTSELGTLKALGWSNGRVVANVATGTMVQALLGGLAGTAIALAAAWGINQAGITVGGSAGGGERPGGGMPTATQQDSGTTGGSDAGAAPQAPADGAMPTGDGMPGGGGGGMGRASSTPTTLTLTPDAASIAGGLGTALAGGLLAAGAGSIAITRLRPAAALRSVD